MSGSCHLFAGNFTHLLNVGCNMLQNEKTKTKTKTTTKKSAVENPFAVYILFIHYLIVTQNGFVQ